MSGVLDLLRRSGVDVKWISGRLRLDYPPSALTDEELALLREHRGQVGGWLLLQELWRAGYRLELVPSERDVGFTIIPTGRPTKRVDFPALFALYEAFHDEAVGLLLETCKLLGIDPTD